MSAIRFSLIIVFIYTCVLSATNIYAAPIGGSITHGTGSIDNREEKITNIIQESDQLIIDWDSFNLANDEEVNFAQPSAESMVLNNILQYDTSTVNGIINANGRVFLINPRGLIFGSDAQINTADLIVSSLSVVKDEFINGEFVFKDIYDNQGVIINNGTITASSGVSFIAESLINRGLIQAELGYINMAAGKQAYLTFDDQGYMGVKVDEAVLNNTLGLKQAVENSGQLLAAGRVAISAQTSNQLFDQAINNTGIVKANGFNLNSVENPPTISFKSNGDINNSGSLVAANTLLAANDLGAGRIIISGKDVVHSGELDASSTRSQGGYVGIHGEQIKLAGSASVNANGDKGGGIVLIGGSHLDQDSGYSTASSTIIGIDSYITANAGIHGDGGEIVIGSDSDTQFFGTVETTSGIFTGDGGRIEISSKEQLSFSGNTVLSTQALSKRVEEGKSKAGELMIAASTLRLVADDITADSDASITSIKTSQLIHLLDAANVQLLAYEDVIIESAIESDSYNRLKLDAIGSLTFNSDISMMGVLELSAMEEMNGAGNISIGDTLDISAINEIINFNGLVSALDLSTQLHTNNGHSIDLLKDGSFNIASANFNDFTKVNINGGRINGIDLTGLYAIKGVQQIEVNNTLFSQVSSVVGGEGVDIILGLDNQHWYLSGIDNQVIGSEISFYDIESVENGHVIGTVGADQIELLAGQSIQANSVRFENITSINTGDNTDTITGGDVWTVAITANTPISLKANDITITNAEMIYGNDNATLFGTSDADHLVFNNSGTIEFNNVEFSNFTHVDAREGNDDIQYDFDKWLVDDENKILLEGINFSNIDTVNINNSIGITDRKLVGTGLDDTFTLIAENTISINGITYYGMGMVSSGQGVDTLIGSDHWQLTELGFKSYEIEFNGFEQVYSGYQGVLIGTNASDEFRLLSDGNGSTDVLINNTTVFSNITHIQGGSQGASGINQGDRVIIDREQEWQLIDNDAFRIDQILFNDIEQAIATSSTVTGSTGQDIFEFNGLGNTIVANNVYFENVTMIDGADSDELGDQININSNHSINILDANGISNFNQDSENNNLAVFFKNIERLEVTTPKDVYLSTAFDRIAVNANNLTIESQGDVTFDELNVDDNVYINSEGSIIFINDVEFISKNVDISALSIEFNKGLAVVTNNFNLEADRLIVDGGIDVDVEVDRSVPIDIGEDISSSIFNEINIFLASEGSIRIDDAIDDAESFKWLLSEIE